MYKKYRSDYQINLILTGEASEEIKSRVKSAKFDERLALLGLLIGGVTEELKNVCFKEEISAELLRIIKIARTKLAVPNASVEKVLACQVEDVQGMLERGKKASTLSQSKQNVYLEVIDILYSIISLVENSEEKSGDVFKVIKTEYDKHLKTLKNVSADAGTTLSNVFKFCEEVFGDGQEMLILVTELTINYYGTRFIARYGCKEYFEHNKELLFYERQKEIISEIEKLDL